MALCIVTYWLSMFYNVSRDYTFLKQGVTIQLQ